MYTRTWRRVLTGVSSLPSLCSVWSSGEGCLVGVFPSPGAGALPAPGSNHCEITMTRLERAKARTRKLEDVEREHILATIRRFGGHRVHAAQALGIGIPTIYRKLRKYNFEGYDCPPSPGWTRQSSWRSRFMTFIPPL